MSDEAPKKKKSKLKLLIILIILVGGGFAGYKFLWPIIEAKFMGPQAATTQASSSKESSGGDSAEHTSGGNTVTLPTFMVNLADPLGRRYIKLTIEVDLTNPEAVAELDNNKGRVRDAINLLLSSKSYADLAPSENKLLLKNEIVEKLNQILGGPKVARVYFLDIVIE